MQGNCQFIFFYKIAPLAVFYKILIDNMDNKDWKVVSSEFDFVEPDKNKNFQKRKIFIEPADVETVKHQLTEVSKGKPWITQIFTN